MAIILDGIINQMNIDIQKLATPVFRSVSSQQVFQSLTETLKPVDFGDSKWWNSLGTLASEISNEDIITFLYEIILRSIVREHTNDEIKKLTGEEAVNSALDMQVAYAKFILENYHIGECQEMGTLAAHNLFHQLMKHRGLGFANYHVTLMHVCNKQQMSDTNHCFVIVGKIDPKNIEVIEKLNHLSLDNLFTLPQDFIIFDPLLNCIETIEDLKKTADEHPFITYYRELRLDASRDLFRVCQIRADSQENFDCYISRVNKNYDDLLAVKLELDFKLSKRLRCILESMQHAAIPRMPEMIELIKLKIAHTFSIISDRISDRIIESPIRFLHGPLPDPNHELYREQLEKFQYTEYSKCYAFK